MARRPRHQHEEHLNHEAWAIPYADLLTLLLAFFVVMYAISSLNEGKYRVVADALSAAFGGAPRSIKPVQVGQVQLRGGDFDQPSMIDTGARRGDAPTPARPWVVAKFGGTSVSTRLRWETIRRIAAGHHARGRPRPQRTDVRCRPSHFRARPVDGSIGPTNRPDPGASRPCACFPCSPPSPWPRAWLPPARPPGRAPTPGRRGPRQTRAPAWPRGIR